MENTSNTHIITAKYYSLKDIEEIIESLPKLSMSDEAISKIEKGHEFVITKSREDLHIYGVNTGFGSLCETRILDSEMELLQYNHVISHAVGVGPIVPERLSRLTLFIKLLTFRWGSTGISMDVVNRFLDFWNNGIIPTIPQKGSVGASGDLAPLAHMGLPLIGLGSVYQNGEVVKTDKAFAELGWKPLRLKPKEGLAITNGIQYINANAVDSLLEIGDFVRSADVIASMSAQAFSTSKTFYQPLYHTTSYHPERTVVAKNFVKLMEGSNHSELDTCNKSKQDPYSFRCIPQVHGAVRQAYNYACDIVEKEVNSVSDNPLFFPEEDEILFGGALHGESTALTLDFLAIALSELVYVSERRTYQLLSGQRGLPDFLVAKFGLNSGLMIAQYTSAALVNENKVMATPASIDTIPTCQLQEDHVSMGATSAYKLKTIRDNANFVFAIELLHAAQAIDFNKELTLSPKTQQIFDEFRKHVDFLDVDRVISDDIEKARAFLRSHRRQWIDDMEIQ
ncbi:MAG: histidine ammonia-lyase [Kangiella sp.]|nr:MAG: histidine ammonia-lyase [Kangiella sp.]